MSMTNATTTPDSPTLEDRYTQWGPTGINVQGLTHEELDGVEIVMDLMIATRPDADSESRTRAYIAGRDLLGSGNLPQVCEDTVRDLLAKLQEKAA
jgi:hypothetical protein